MKHRNDSIQKDNSQDNAEKSDWGVNKNMPESLFMS